jgi:hypothetical protein
LLERTIDRGTQPVDKKRDAFYCFWTSRSEGRHLLQVVFPTKLPKMTPLNANVWTRSVLVFCLVAILPSSNRSLAKSQAEPPVLPTPQFYQSLEGRLTLPKGPLEVVFVLPARVEPSIRVARELILKGLEDAGVEAKVVELQARQPLGKNDFNVILLPYSELPASDQRSLLSNEDRSLLTRNNATGQEYVLVTAPREKAAYLKRDQRSSQCRVPSR